MSAARGHVVIVTEAVAFDPEHPEYVADIECLNVALCGGFQECLGDHDGFDPHDEDSPAYDEWDDVEIHGVTHQYRYGWNWTVPYAGCVVRDNDGPQDEAREIASQRGVGRYAVEDEWDGEECYLSVIENTPLNSRSVTSSTSSGSAPATEEIRAAVGPVPRPPSGGPGTTGGAS